MEWCTQQNENGPRLFFRKELLTDFFIAVNGLKIKTIENQVIVKKKSGFLRRPAQEPTLNGPFIQG
jgi:hypothetical protein